MAPVKPATAATGKTTRSTRAAAVAKKTESRAEKNPKPSSSSTTVKTRTTSTAPTTTGRTRTARTKVTKSVPVTRRTRSKTDETESDAEAEEESDHEKEGDGQAATDVQPRDGKTRPSSRASRSTRAKDTAITAPARRVAATTMPAPATTSAPPRRRLRVTPLDASEDVAAPESVLAEAEVKKSATRASKKTAPTEEDEPKLKPGKKAREDAAEATADMSEVVQDVVPTTRTRSTRATPNVMRGKKNTKATASDNSTIKETGSRPRGRPKRTITAVESEEPSDNQPTHATRSTRAGSVLSVTATDVPTVDADAKKSVSTTAPKKRVKFEDILGEDDKENRPLKSQTGKVATTKRATTRAATASTSASGMRARPLRKPVASSSQAVTATTSKRSATASKVETSSAPVPRALTPKKITQVARSGAQGHDDDENEGRQLVESEGEDELHGDKTPIRDLSLSPRRPTSSAVANALSRTLSPAKQLNFDQPLVAASPAKPALFSNTTAGDSVLASPARRLPVPASSVMDAVAEASPRRGMAGEATRLLFPLAVKPQGERADAGTSFSASATLQQSPKRPTNFGADRMFPMSAMRSAKKSPFKVSLFGSPAKRLLFSPLKQSTVVPLSRKTPELDEGEDEVDNNADEDAEDVAPPLMDLDVTGLVNANEVEEVTVSSHQRAISSPLRVHKVVTHDEIAPAELEFDFDRSVLPVGSPLRVAKSPLKQVPSAKKTPVIDDLTGPVFDVGPEPLQKPEQVVEPEDLDESASPGQLDKEETQVDVEVEGEVVQPARSTHDNFRTSNFREPDDLADGDETSEDELAKDDTQTSIPPSRSQSRRKSTLSRMRESTSGAGENGFGFTPLAAQMADRWKASSPLKRTQNSRLSQVAQDIILTPAMTVGALDEKDAEADERGEDGEDNGGDDSGFSPAARQHVDGMITITRDNTPARKFMLSGRKSASKLRAKSPGRVRTPASTRNVGGGRQSLGLLSSAVRRPLSSTPTGRGMGADDSPLNINNANLLDNNMAENLMDADRFDEAMEVRAQEQQVESDSIFDASDDVEQGRTHDSELATENLEFDEIMDVDGHDSKQQDDELVEEDSDTEEEGDTVLVQEEDAGQEDNLGARNPTDLTTDLINFTHATDTAMIDFGKLAEEANQKFQAENKTNEDVRSDRELTADEIDADNVGESGLTHDEPVIVPAEGESTERFESDGLADQENTDTSPGVGSDVEEEQLNETTGTTACSSSPPVSPDAVSLREHELTEMISPSASEQGQESEEQVQPEASSPSPSDKPDSALVEATVSAEETTLSIVTPTASRPTVRKFNVNTVVSKVPLRPEGHMSPMKLLKKRALSFGSNGNVTRSTKRVSFGRLPDMPAQNMFKSPVSNEASPAKTVMSDDVQGKDVDAIEHESQDEEVDSRRMSRTSVAPSPNGTSTPAFVRSKSPRSTNSMTSKAGHGGTSSAVSTPGMKSRLSFGVSDFGDSTLDGIDLPDEEDDEEEEERDELEPSSDTDVEDDAIMIDSVEANTPRPLAQHLTTPATSKSKRAETAISTTKKPSTGKTPTTVKKTPSRAAVTTTTPATADTKKTLRTSTKQNAVEKTPLDLISNGVLSGAVVYVDVRTSEGADASGIFIELLTSMGARCLREWKVNTRTSIGQSAESPNTSGSSTSGVNRAGVTHVVFKDGSPKTLGKIRQASSSVAFSSSPSFGRGDGHVWCIGVGWVLDCEKEQKWVDERNYTIDPAVASAYELTTGFASDLKGDTRGNSRRRKSMEPSLLVADGMGSVKRSKSSRRSIGLGGLGSKNVSAEVLAGAKRDLLEIATPRAGSRSASGSSVDSVNTTTTAAAVAPPTTTEQHSDGNMSDDDEDDDGYTQDENAISTPTGYVAYDPRTAMTPGHPMTPYLISEGRQLVQMSAPPKQVGRSLFARDGDEEDGDGDGDADTNEKEDVNEGDEEDSLHRLPANTSNLKETGPKGRSRKFRLSKSNVEQRRRQTLGGKSAFKPVVGSPLGK